MSAVGLPEPHFEPHFNSAGLCICRCADCTSRLIVACVCLDCPCDGDMGPDHLPDGEELAPYDLLAEPKAYVFLQPGWEEKLKELTARDTQIEAFDATPPPWAFDHVRAPMCRCSVLPIEGEYCNVCENFPCLGGHPPVE